MRRLSWRENHVVDEAIRGVFATTAKSVMEANYLLNRGCNRINVMLTINAAHLARDGETAQAVLRRVMKQCVNLYRNVPQTFAGVWRYEVGTDRYGGCHYHIAFHAPRGMRDHLLDALQGWFDEPLDPKRSSRSSRNTRWKAYGIRGGWQLCRIYELGGALDYIAKVRTDGNGEPLSRAARLGKARVREFATFGRRNKDRTP